MPSPPALLYFTVNWERLSGVFLPMHDALPITYCCMPKLVQSNLFNLFVSGGVFGTVKAPWVGEWSVGGRDEVGGWCGVEWSGGSGGWEWVGRRRWVGGGSGGVERREEDGTGREERVGIFFGFVPLAASSQWC